MVDDIVDLEKAKARIDKCGRRDESGGCCHPNPPTWAFLAQRQSLYPPSPQRQLDNPRQTLGLQAFLPAVSRVKHMLDSSREAPCQRTVKGGRFTRRMRKANPLDTW
jgi:hypothetical protein